MGLRTLNLPLPIAIFTSVPPGIPLIILECEAGRSSVNTPIKRAPWRGVLRRDVCINEDESIEKRGVPEHLSRTINFKEEPWHTLIVDFEWQRRVGRTKKTVSGRGRAAELSRAA